ncbi:hypothetical protein CN059_31910 [Sinorhizobium medicae]|nr:hypothetical protein CN059_31910 [Sinorhizobium medicae]
MRYAVFCRTASVRLAIRVVALIPEHEFEGDGKSFPRLDSPYHLGGSARRRAMQTSGMRLAPGAISLQHRFSLLLNAQRICILCRQHSQRGEDGYRRSHKGARASTRPEPRFGCGFGDLSWVQAACRTSH